MYEYVRRATRCNIVLCSRTDYIITTVAAAEHVRTRENDNENIRRQRVTERRRRVGVFRVRPIVAGSRVSFRPDPFVLRHVSVIKKRRRARHGSR